MTDFVCRRTGRTYRIGDRLDADGQGAVHAVEPASSGLVFKRYLPEALQKRPELEARAKAMITRPPAYRTDRRDRLSCAWPEDVAYIDDRFAGFVMPHVATWDTRTVHDVATSPDTPWADRVAVAADLARVVALLHDHGVVVGEFHGPNVLTWRDHRVTLLGCDRMQVADPGSPRRFPVLARRSDLPPPELGNELVSGMLREPSSDIFSLAVLLHLLLLEEHPFRGEWRGRGARPTELALAGRGLWAYAGDRRLEPRPGAMRTAVLTPALRRCFRAAFVDGARAPGRRPPAREWVAALTDLQRSLVTCPREPGHVHGDHLPDCPWCPPGERPASPAARPAPPAARPAPDGDPRAGAPAPAAAATTRLGPAAPRPAGVAAAHPAGVAATRTRPPPPPAPGRRRPSPQPVLPARRRGGLGLAIGAAVAVLGIGGVAAVAGATGRSTPVVIGPAAAATPTVAAGPSPGPLPADPTAALQQVRARDAGAVETLAESWVAQLSARPAGTGESVARTDAAVLAGHDALRKRHPEAVLLWSPDWNYAGELWVTVVNRRFATADEANAWCDANAFPPRECHAKRLSHSDVVDGTARYRG